MQHEEDKWEPHLQRYDPSTLNWDEKYLKRKLLFKARIKPDKPPEAARALARELRRAREARGVTLDEVSANIFINKHFLEAIESGELEKLPGGIYMRSYFKLYARYIQFDENVVQMAFTPSAAVNSSLLSYLFPKAATRVGERSSSGEDQRSRLPKFGEYLLYLFLSKSERVTVIGDLEEEFEAVELKFGKVAAKIYFYKQVLTSLAPFISKSMFRILLELLDRIIGRPKL
jgi:transcriptional regulator with XRE-family HTH domain